jgi:Fe-S-cluster containining protein
MPVNIKYPKVACSRCGNCCSIPVVPVTRKDLARLVKATGKPAKDIVRFCSISEMEYDADAGLWISFASGKRAMVLRKRGEACLFQTKDRTCSAYAGRPQTCRTFPYSVEFEDDKDRAVSKIKLNKILDCNAVKCSEIDIDTLIDNVRKENREDREYYRLIKQWNQTENKGKTADFLKFIGF